MMIDSCFVRKRYVENFLVLILALGNSYFESTMLTFLHLYQLQAW